MPSAFGVRATYMYSSTVSAVLLGPLEENMPPLHDKVDGSVRYCFDHAFCIKNASA